ncbi:hypothetical protein NQ318_006940 [Aromia moschata]|uniref:C2H2-type domain-containing protein n=1 Tax=Aromia moschata TaxID=1265417 RepID=A0AAV8YNS9_9CUCU|nr:hypothetical protein NQ318_006940 [Aromia moschata]
MEVVPRVMCDLCTYKAKQKRYLQRHRKIHFQNPDEIVWYQCEFCSYRSKKKRHFGSTFANS